MHQKSPKQLPAMLQERLIDELVKAEAEVVAAYQAERLKWQELETLKKRIERVKAAIAALGEST